MSVAAFEPLAAYGGPLESCGFSWRSKNDELTKRYFRQLLHRDYLRADPVRAGEYGRLKHSSSICCAARQAYVEAKSPFVWETVRRAYHRPCGSVGSQARRTLDQEDQGTGRSLRRAARRLPSVHGSATFGLANCSVASGA